MLLAAQSMAVGTVLVPWVSRRADNIMATGYHMLLGGLPLAALALAREGDVLLERLPLLTGMAHATGTMNDPHLSTGSLSCLQVLAPQCTGAPFKGDCRCCFYDCPLAHYRPGFSRVDPL